MKALMIDRGMSKMAESVSLRASETRKKLNMFCSFRLRQTATQTRTFPAIVRTTTPKRKRTGQLGDRIPDSAPALTTLFSSVQLAIDRAPAPTDRVSFAWSISHDAERTCSVARAIVLSDVAAVAGQFDQGHLQMTSEAIVCF